MDGHRTGETKNVMSDDRTTWLRQERTLQAGERRRLLGVEIRASWARLLTFGGAVAAVALIELRPLAYAVSGLLLVAFVVAVRSHRAARRKRELADHLLLMFDEALQRCGGHVVLIRDWKRPADAQHPSLPAVAEDGPTWAITEQERDDLDLFSPPVGIFGLLNRTSTSIGARRLRDMLDHLCLSGDHITTRHEAVRWLETHPDERLRMMAATAGLRGQDRYIGALIQAVSDAIPLPWPKTARWIRGWSLITGVFTLIAIAQIGIGDYGWGYALGALLLFNSVLLLGIRRELNRAIAPWRTLSVAVRGLQCAAEQGATDLPGEGRLGRLRDHFTAARARPVLPTLAARIGWSDSGGMFHALCNVVFFYDLHVAGAILHCVLPHRDQLLHGLAALAELEALGSLASFAYESADGVPTCYPRIASQAGMMITAGRHPLVEPDRNVANDLALDNAIRMRVITGSNMAGKSTLLRMAGTNCVLAQIGTVALAEDMSLAPVCLITDLQVRDNLADDESYFLSEVRQLRRMVSPQQDSATVLGLMDEPFRGTNSAEKVAAALAVVEHLLDSSNLFLIATHERQLAEFAARAPGADNHHFREDLSGEGLTFDYKLRPGPATTRNALRVLEREGYPAELLDRAHEWLNDGDGTSGSPGSGGPPS